MERQKPTNPEEFLEISGVGQAKLEKYAANFLKVIKEHSEKKKPKHQEALQLQV